MSRGQKIGQRLLETRHRVLRAGWWPRWGRGSSSENRDRRGGRVLRSRGGGSLKNPAMNVRCCASRRSEPHRSISKSCGRSTAAGSRARSGVIKSASALPMTMGQSSAARSSRHSSGNGSSAATSPRQTKPSAPCSLASSRTASRAGRLPWMSDRMATLVISVTPRHPRNRAVRRGLPGRTSPHVSTAILERSLPGPDLLAPGRANHLGSDSPESGSPLRRL